MTAVECKVTSHSPTLAGGRWSCADCDAAEVAAQEARAAAAAKRAARVSVIPEHERAIFVAAIREAAHGGRVRQNDVRPLVRGRIFHKHIGPLWTWAVSSGLLTELHREPSTDTEGRNAHHDSGVYLLAA